MRKQKLFMMAILLSTYGSTGIDAYGSTQEQSKNTIQEQVASPGINTPIEENKNGGSANGTPAVANTNGGTTGAPAVVNTNGGTTGAPAGSGPVSNPAPAKPWDPVGDIYRLSQGIVNEADKHVQGIGNFVQKGLETIGTTLGGIIPKDIRDMGEMAHAVVGGGMSLSSGANQMLNGPSNGTTNGTNPQPQHCQCPVPPPPCQCPSSQQQGSAPQKQQSSTPASAAGGISNSNTHNTQQAQVNPASAAGGNSNSNTNNAQQAQANPASAAGGNSNSNGGGTQQQENTSGQQNTQQ